MASGTGVGGLLKAAGITPIWDKPEELAAYASSFTERGNGILRDLGLAKN